MRKTLSNTEKYRKKYIYSTLKNIGHFETFLTNTEYIGNLKQCYPTLKIIGKNIYIQH